MSDQYAATAEFYDLVAGPMWEPLVPHLAGAIAGIDPSAGPVLEIGAGTGLATMIVAETLPAAAIVALEPSAAMRGVLLAKLAARPDLHGRVTLLPSGLEGADLPERLAGAVAMHMLGHLDRASRASLWRLFAARLAPDGVAVVNVQPPARPEVVEHSRYIRVRLGELAYEGWMAAQPTGPDSMHWTMTYRVLRDDRPIYERTNEFGWWTLDANDVAEEAAAAGLTATVGEQGLIMLRRA
jgi:SAM-dependent methyltransferase